MHGFLIVLTFMAGTAASRHVQQTINCADQACVERVFRAGEFGDLGSGRSVFPPILDLGMI